jgi:hypothetical protein
MILGYISWKALSEKVKSKALVHMDAKPHIDEPPRSGGIRGCSGGYGNCLYDNQGMVQVI